MSKFFLLISVFDPMFSFLIYNSYILKTVSVILKIFLLVSLSSTDKDYNKKPYTKSLDSFFEQ